MNKKISVICVLVIMSLLSAPIVSAAYNVAGYRFDNWNNVVNPTYNLTTAFPNARVFVENTAGTKTVFYGYNGTNSHSIYMANKTASSSTWTTPYKVYENPDKYNITEIAAAIDSTNAFHLAFRFYNFTATTWHIGYINSTAGSWGALTILTNVSGHNASFPAIAIDSADQAQIVYSLRNATNTNHSVIVIVNSSNLDGQKIIKGIWNSTLNNDTYTYPSIGINATDIIFVSFHRQNYTSSLFLVGLLTYDGATSTSYMIGQNESRNACLTLNNTYVSLVYKAYNSTTDTSNITYVAFTQAAINVRTHWLEIRTHNQAEIYIYPSMSLSDVNGTGAHDIMVCYTPFYNATTWTQQRTIILNHTLEEQQYRANGGNFNSRLFIFSHTRWSNYNNPNGNHSDQINVWYDGETRLSYNRGNVPAVGLGASIVGVLQEWLPLLVLISIIATLFSILGLKKFIKRH